MYMKMPLRHNKQAAASLRIRPRIAFSQENACNVFLLSLWEARPRLPNARVKPVPGAGTYSITQFREKVYNFFCGLFTDLTEKELHLWLDLL